MSGTRCANWSHSVKARPSPLPSASPVRHPSPCGQQAFHQQPPANCEEFSKGGCPALRHCKLIVESSMWMRFLFKGLQLRSIPFVGVMTPQAGMMRGEGKAATRTRVELDGVGRSLPFHHGSEQANILSSPIITYNSTWKKNILDIS